MTRITVTLAILAALALSGVASASSSTRDPRVPALQAQIRTLQARVAEITSVVNRNADVAECRFAYQFRFNVGVLNIFALMLGAAEYSGGYPSDNGACARVGQAPPGRRALQSASPLGLPGLLVSMAGLR